MDHAAARVISAAAPLAGGQPAAARVALRGPLASGG